MTVSRLDSSNSSFVSSCIILASSEAFLAAGTGATSSSSSSASSSVSELLSLSLPLFTLALSDDLEMAESSSDLICLSGLDRDEYSSSSSTSSAPSSDELDALLAWILENGFRVVVKVIGSRI